MASDDSTKAAALYLIERGELTQSEAARLSGISRQLMRYWCRDIDPDKARAAYMSRVWKKAVARFRE